MLILFFSSALRLAQTVQDNAAITYIYDCMANLAYELGDLEKAEKIFVSVCQRLMQYDGAKEDDIRVRVFVIISCMFILKFHYSRCSIFPPR